MEAFAHSVPAQGRKAHSGPRRPRKTPRSAVTTGRRVHIVGDGNSVWSRRYTDLVHGHISDLGGIEAISVAQLSLCRRAATIETQLEGMEGAMSLGQEVDLDLYGRLAGHLRRILETLGVRRHPRDVSPKTLHEYVRTRKSARAGIDSNGR